MLQLLYHSLMTKLSTPPFFCKFFKHLKHITLLTYLLPCPTVYQSRVHDVHELFAFFFYQSTVLSSCAEHGRQMYFGGSVVGKASTTGIGISPLLILTGGSKSAKFGIVQNITQFGAACIWKCSKISEFWKNVQCCNAARYPNSEKMCNAAIIVLCTG